MVSGMKCQQWHVSQCTFIENQPIETIIRHKAAGETYSMLPTPRNTLMPWAEIVIMAAGDGGRGQDVLRGVR